MYVHTELEPYLIFLNIFLTLCWSLSTWLTMQNKKLHSELIPQNQFISKNGLVMGTLLMIFCLYFLSLFYNELRFAMTLIFGAIMVGVGSYLAKYFEWLIFLQEIKSGYWKQKLTTYFFDNYGNGLGPKSTQKVLESMISEWWVKILPISMESEIRETLKKIVIESDKYSRSRDKYLYSLLYITPSFITKTTL